MTWAPVSCGPFMRQPLMSTLPIGVFVTPNTSDKLVKKAVEGSRQALDKIVQDLQVPVFTLALRMLFHPQDAEDATQEILIKIITHLNSFRFESSLRSWALRIASNHLSTVRKKRNKRLELNMKETVQIIDRAEARGWFSKALEPPEPLMEREMISVCTQALLQALNRDQRVAFILGAIVEVSSVEGAYILDISPAAFRKRLSRARHLIMDFLSTQCGFFESSNRCSCAGVYQGHVKMGWLDAKRPIFASSSHAIEPSVNLRQYMTELDEINRMSVMFKSFPKNRSTIDLASIIKTSVKNKNYRILSDPQMT
jgi:RNA polymerase sigma factor (sigma-70 family)